MIHLKYIETHWRVIAQPVSARWSCYGKDIFFVTADKPEGRWNAPKAM